MMRLMRLLMRLTGMIDICVMRTTTLGMMRTVNVNTKHGLSAGRGRCGM